jgi:hypothetical protein
MSHAHIAQLNDDQLKVFDTEHVNDRQWIPIKRCIDRDFPDGRFTFLDLGGGNGNFADRLLENYPRSRGAVLDNSELLLSRNKPHPNKRLVFGSIENLDQVVDAQYDLIFFNWVLHHLVIQSSYARTRESMRLALRAALPILTDRGRVSIYEDLYNGLLIDGAPGWLVYQLTTVKTIARLIRSLGANTAGVGVCFLSHKQWCSTLKRNGLRVLDYTNDDLQTVPWTRTAFLHVGRLRCGHFWLSRNGLEAAPPPTPFAVTTAEG